VVTGSSAFADDDAERMFPKSRNGFRIRSCASYDRSAMLSRISIRDIVLIDRLDIDFAEGLAVLTGETGAGKSILLDAFALALGARGDQALVRQGAEQGQVTAVFDEAELVPGDVRPSGLPGYVVNVMRRPAAGSSPVLLVDLRQLLAIAA